MYIAQCREHLEVDKEFWRYDKKHNKITISSAHNRPNRPSIGPIINVFVTVTYTSLGRYNRRECDDNV